MLFRLGCIGLSFFVWELSGHAHPIPTLVVETVFEQNGNYELKVNLDPRLFLNPVPSSLPPVPGTWWVEQDASAQAKNKKEAVDYLGRTVQFLQSSSSTPLSLNWEILAVDSVLITPLTATSAEVHLLASHRGKLVASGGDFKVALDKSSAVPAIVVNRVAPAGKPEPQSVYPGESSRTFPLPIATTQAPPEPKIDSSTHGHGTEARQGESAQSLNWRVAAVVALAFALVATILWQRRNSPTQRGA